MALSQFDSEFPNIMKDMSQILGTSLKGGQEILGWLWQSQAYSFSHRRYSFMQHDLRMTDSTLHPDIYTKSLLENPKFKLLNDESVWQVLNVK